MKAIALLLLISAAAAGQSLDSLNARVTALEQENERIKSELWRSHEKFRLGAIITGVGLLLCGFEAITYVADVDNDGLAESDPYFAYIGGGMMIAGSIVMIESHRHIGLAGHNKKSKTWRPFQSKRKKKVAVEN